MTRSDIEIFRELREKYITQPGENVIPGEGEASISDAERRRRKKLARKKADRSLQADIARKRAQSRYYRKNKEELNRKRAVRNRDPYYAFLKSKNRSKYTSIPWELTFEEFVEVWTEVEPVLDTGSGFYVTAWSKRGSNPRECAQMVRRDLEGSWNKDNVYIAYKGCELTTSSDQSDRA